MKRKIFSVFSLLLCYFAVFLTGCGQSNSEYDVSPPHTHSYTTTIIAPTCTEQGYTLHSCINGDDSYKDTFKNPLGHTYVEGARNYYCSRCQVSEAASFTFKQATMDGESCYVITNANSSAVVNGKLEVPRKYESLPVRGIMTYSFSGVAKQVKTLVIHDNIKNIYSYLWNGTSIWNADLESTSSLETIIFDNTFSDMRIESNAFYNCVNLRNVNITKGMIRYIPCDAVTTLNGGNAEYLFYKTPFFKNNATVKNGLYYVADLLLHADMNEIDSDIVIENGTIAVNASLLYNGTFITSVTIPKTVKSIGEKTFNGCSNLETITFNGTIAEFEQITIGASAFSNLKTNKIICSDGEVKGYRYNGYYYAIGQ